MSITDDPGALSIRPAGEASDTAKRRQSEIAESKRREDALLESETRFRTLVSLAPVGVFLTDAGGRCIYANKGWLEMTGQTLEALQGDSWTQNIPSDDRERIAEVWKNRIVERGSGKFEYSFQTPAGNIVWVLGSASSLHDSQGRVTGYISVNMDITERKRAAEDLRLSEEKYKIVADNTYDWVFWIDPEGQFKYNSPSCTLTTGFNAGEMMNYRDVLAILFSDDDRQIVERHRDECELNRIPGKLEFRIRHADGRFRWIEHICNPVFDDAGTFLGSRGSNRDITERKAIEQLFRDVQRRESIGVLSSGIAHDYNNLLGIMMGNISLAQAQLPAGHPAIQNIEKALTAMERAGELTQQMLAYSGLGKFQVRTFDLAAVVRDRVSLFNASLPKNVGLVMHLPSTPIYVNGDPGQIEQIIVNLIINGGEAIGDKQGSVSITIIKVTMGADELVPYKRITNTSLSEGAYVLLEVRDNGTGMSPEIMAKIFDPFFTTKLTGRGLGLSAVLGIIQGHNGGLTMASNEELGTTFRVILPAAPSPVSVQEPASGAPQTQAAAANTILVIDDEIDVATMAQEILETGNYTVLVEVSPLRGIELYKQHRSEIRAVLLDMTMPEMSGKEVVDALQAIDRGVKIIITSGYSEEEVVKKIGAASVSAFIKKPYRFRSLLDIVRSVTPGHIVRGNENDDQR